MSTADAEAPVDSPGPIGDEIHDAHHPTDAKYVQVAAILALVTALEVATYFVEMPGEVLIPAVDGDDGLQVLLRGRVVHAPSL